uniref:Uncharacterized protein n=1 Tax=Rhizophora mucronata TaxID=61149 RepID=A0A2P2J7Q3_RHIMU
MKSKTQKTDLPVNAQTQRERISLFYFYFLFLVSMVEEKEEYP